MLHKKLEIVRYVNAHASAALPFDGLLFLQNETNSYAFCSRYYIITQLGWYLQNALLYKARPKYCKVNEIKQREGASYGRRYRYAVGY